MTEEQGQYLSPTSTDAVYRTIDKIAEYAKKYLSGNKEAEDRVHYMNIAILYALIDRMVPQSSNNLGSYDLNAVARANAGYHLQKAGLEAKVDKYDATTGQEKVVGNSTKKPEKTPYAPAPTKSSDNPATDVARQTESFDDLSVVCR